MLTQSPHRNTHVQRAGAQPLELVTQQALGLELWNGCHKGVLRILRLERERTKKPPVAAHLTTGDAHGSLEQRERDAEPFENGEGGRVNADGPRVQ